MGRMNAVWTWTRQHGVKLLWGVLALFLGAAMLRWWVGPQVQTEAVLRRDVLQTVVASGRVETPHRVNIGAQIIGTVARVPVTEGQTVKAGDVLVELVGTELLSARRQAQQAVVQAQNRLRQMNELQGPVVQQTLRQAQASLDTAQANWQRNEALFDQGFIGQAALDESRKALALADAQVRAAQQQVISTRAGGAEHSLALGAVLEAQANAETVNAKARYAVIQAPASGQLIGRNVEVGDVITASPSRKPSSTSTHAPPRKPSRTGRRTAMPACTSQTQGDVPLISLTRPTCSANTCGWRATTKSTDTVMSCLRFFWGSSTSSLISTAPVWALMPGLM